MVACITIIYSSVFVMHVCCGHYFYFIYFWCTHVGNMSGGTRVVIKIKMCCNISMYNGVPYSKCFKTVLQNII